MHLTAMAIAESFANNAGEVMSISDEAGTNCKIVKWALAIALQRSGVTNLALLTLTGGSIVLTRRRGVAATP